MKNGKKSAIDIAKIRLDHVPFVVTNNRKMAVWSDVKEILLWCPSPHCCVVLDVMKLILGYPDYEIAMHPCSQLEQLMFLKHFMFVSHGTLLVDIDSLNDGAKLALLYNMVKERHTRPSSETVFNCTKMLKKFTEMYANTSFKIPLSSASAKQLLPAVRRISKKFSSGDDQASEGKFYQPKAVDKDDGDSPEVIQVVPKFQTEVKTLVPLALLCKLYPGCEIFLSEVMRLYVLGQCGEENLLSVSQCTVEEGIQLTRFLASQNGYERFWLCLTTCSLMMSWSEFWLGIDRMCGGGIQVMSRDICVVTLNCQTTEVRQTQKNPANASIASQRQTIPTQPSPTLSAINDITKNVQSQNVSGPLAIFSEESPSLGSEETDSCKCDDNCKVDIKMSVKNSVPSDETEVSKEIFNPENDTVIGKCEKVVKDNEKELDIENQGQLKQEERKCSGKRGKKKLGEMGESRSSRRQRNKEVDIPKTDDEGVAELRTTQNTKTHKTKRKSKKSRKVGNDATDQDTVPKGIKSRLRSRNQEARNKSIEIKSNTSKEDANNSAVVNAMSLLKTSGFVHSNKSESKSVETTKSVHPSAEEVADRNKAESLSQCTPYKFELPMSEVSPYDLASIEYPQMEGIEVSITPKKGIPEDNIPGEINAYQNLVKKNFESVQSIRNRREILKISSAQIQDEIPQTLKYISNFPEVKAACTPVTEQTCSITRNRGKVDNRTGPGSQVEDKWFKSNKLEYISLTPKQLELTGPILRCPNPGTMQESKKNPYKPVKNMGETAKKNRGEVLKQHTRDEAVSEALDGKPLQSPKKGVLHEEIVNNLQNQAVNSFCSVSPDQDGRRQLSAEGKAVKKYERAKDLNSTDFMKERITMWREEVEQSLYLPSPGRLSKSADLIRERKMCMNRPRSSIYSSQVPQFDSRGSSIKTALCALYSRDCSSPKMYDEQSHFQTSANEAYDVQDYSSSSTHIANNDTPEHTGRGKGQIKLDNQYDVQGYGSSSSVTPDIYDEFARKRKPKSLRPDIVRIKPRPVTIPIPTTLTQPVVRKQAQPSLQMSRKPNFHTVGYISGTEPLHQMREDSPCYANQDLKQTYRYSYGTHAQNLPHYSQTKLIHSLSQQGGVVSNNPNTVCIGHLTQLADSEENTEGQNEILCAPQTSCNMHVEKSLPQVLSSSSVQSDGKSQSIENSNHSPESIESPVDQGKRFDDDTSVEFILGQEKSDKYNQKQVAINSMTGMNCNTDDKKNNTSSAINKYLNFRDYVASPGKLESLEYVSSLQAFSGAYSICSVPVKGSHLHEFEDCMKTCQSEMIPSTSENEMNAAGSRTEQAVMNGQRSKNNLKYEEKSFSSTSNQEITREHNLSKVNTQLYYKVPGDDTFYTVSENMMIPRYAQFFVQTTATEYDQHAHSKKLVQDKERLEQNLIKDVRNCNEADVKDVRLETETNECREILNDVTDLTEKEKFSGTTFDSIIKASEYFIDKSRLIKHVISKTKQAIAKTETDEDDESPANKTENSRISSDPVEEVEESDKCNNTREENKYPKVIIPSYGQTIEAPVPVPKKSFKEIIEEKREERRKIQQDLSRKKYWYSAQAKKDGNLHLSVDKTFNKKRNGDYSAKARVKAGPKQKSTYTQHKANFEKPKLKQTNNVRQMDSKFVTSSQQRPKACVSFSKGRTTNNVSKAGRIEKNDFPSTSAKSQTYFATKQKHARTGTANTSTYQQPTKPATIFQRPKYLKRQQPKEANDCTTKILTALRRLSIEKSPKNDEQKGSSKQEVRQTKLRSCLAKQTSVGKSVKVSATSRPNDLQKKGSEDVSEVHGYENNKEEVEQVYTKSNTKVSNIPVVIGMRKDYCEEIPEVHENFFEDKGDKERYDNDVHNRGLQMPSHDLLEQSNYDENEHENDKQKDSSECDTNQETGPGKESFITLYDTRALALYSLGSAGQRSTSNSSINVNQQNEEKYLGMPFFQDANSNMNNMEYLLPVESIETKKCPEVNLNILKEGTEETLVVANDQLHNMHCFPDSLANISETDPLVQTQVDSITSIRHEKIQDHQDLIHPDQWEAGSDITGQQHFNADLNSCSVNTFPSGQTPYQDTYYPQQYILSSNDVDQAANLDPDRLHMTFNQNIDGNTGDDYYLSQRCAKSENNDIFTTVEEWKGQDQGHNRFTYVAYDNPTALEGHSGHLVNQFDEVKLVSFGNESNMENGICQFMKNQKMAWEVQNTYELDPYLPDQPCPTGDNSSVTNICIYHSDMTGCLEHQTNLEIVNNSDCQIDEKENLEEADLHSENLINEENLLEKCQEQRQPAEKVYIEGNCLDNSDNGEFFLDETECGQEVCIGNSEADGKDIKNIENGLCSLQENELVNSKCLPRNDSSDMFNCKDEKDIKEKDINIVEQIRVGLEKDSDMDKNQEELTEEKGIKSSIKKHSGNVFQAEVKKSNLVKKSKKSKPKLKDKKTKKIVQNNLEKSKHTVCEEKYSPSQSEVEAYFEEVTKRTGIMDTATNKCKNGGNRKDRRNCDSDEDPESDDSLPEFDLGFNVDLNKNKSNQTGKGDIIKTQENKSRDYGKLSLEDDDDNDGDVDSDDSYGDDDDYNPVDDLEKLEENSDYSGSDDETSAKDARGNISTGRGKNGQRNFISKKSVGVSLANIRKQFQKKYNVKNSSAIHEWKNKSQKEDRKHMQNMGSRSRNSGKRKSKEKSVVREFCLKNSQKKKDARVEKARDRNSYLENLLESHSNKRDKHTDSIAANISASESSLKESMQNTNTKSGKSMDMKGIKHANCETTQLPSKNIQKTRKKKKGKRNVNDETLDDDENSEDEKRKQNAENMAAEGFIRTQKRYYEILRNSTAGAQKDDIEASDEPCEEEPTVDELSEVIEAVPVHGERIITKALTNAEKALEGTGSLEDIHNEDEGTVIEDLINQCSYQMIEDEDHVQLGGVAHFMEFTLPFVYINGYKYTPLKDALTIFTPECCVSACTIPRSVLHKHKTLVKSFSTWEQVYKLELIKMKKRPSIMTGDTLVKLDTLLTILPELIQQIVKLHIGTTLKRSKKCDISAYSTLISKFM